MSFNAIKENSKLLFVITCAIILNLLGAILGKYAANNIGLTPFFCFLFLLICTNYFLRTIFWVIIGKYYQLSYIYPVLSINYVFAFLVGMLLFKEAFAWNHLIGAITITLGVSFITQSKHRKEKTS